MPIAFEVLAEHLRANAWEVVPKWFPNGRRQGREWCLGSLDGGAGQSLKINLDSGKWQDFATGERGGDLIALYAAQHKLSQSDAARELGADESLPVKGNGATGRQAPPPPLEELPEVLAHHDPARERPPSDIALHPQHFRHPTHGVPAYVYAYRDDDGELLSVVARYEGSEGKQFSPWTWHQGRWRMKAPPKPRPLYGLDRLARLEGRVVVVEGEKAADALQGILRRSPVITWPNGAVNWRYADWRPVAGRKVLLWPDADYAGVEAMQGVASTLIRLGCEDLAVIETQELPEGYDAADFVATGAHGAELVSWLKARERKITRVDQRKEPQRIDSPEAIEGVLIPGEHEPPPLTEADAPQGMGSVPQLLQAAGVLFGSKGAHVNLSNAKLVVDELVRREVMPAVWWDDFLCQVRTPSGEWSDRDTLALTARFQRDLTFDKISTAVIDQAVALHAWEHRRNCAQEWLQGLKWDGTERLSHLLTDGFGVRVSPYAMAVGRCFVMGMVARVLMPGCKVDNLPVFEGEQGITKSQALAALGGPWFTETMESVTSKDFYLSLTGKILVEISEFSSFHRAEAEAIKAAITRQTDRYRVPYERRPADHPRSCVFAATTNRRHWSKDPTGARRFWPVKCGLIDVGWITVNREQLFAEAVMLVRLVPEDARPAERLACGAAWWDVPQEDAVIQQRARYRDDAQANAMRQFVAAQTQPFSTFDVARFGLNLDGLAALEQRVTDRIDAQLTHWGYDSEVREESGLTFHVWLPKRPQRSGDSE